MSFNQKMFGLGNKRSIIREILLSGAGNVYCFGEIEKDTERFLKKYYKEKVVFC